MELDFKRLASKLREPEPQLVPSYGGSTLEDLQIESDNIQQKVVKRETETVKQAVKKPVEVKKQKDSTKELEEWLDDIL